MLCDSNCTYTCEILTFLHQDKGGIMHLYKLYAVSKTKKNTMQVEKCGLDYLHGGKTNSILGWFLKTVLNFKELLFNQEWILKWFYHTWQQYIDQCNYLLREICVCSDNYSLSTSHENNLNKFKPVKQNLKLGQHILMSRLLE